MPPSTKPYMTNQMALGPLLTDTLRMLSIDSWTIIGNLLVSIKLTADLVSLAISSSSFVQQFWMLQFSRSTSHSLWTTVVTTAAVSAQSSLNYALHPDIETWSCLSFQAFSKDWYWCARIAAWGVVMRENNIQVEEYKAVPFRLSVGSYHQGHSAIVSTSVWTRL